MEITGTIKELIPKMMELDSSKEYIIKEFRKKRSLTANGYYWELISKIANQLRNNKDYIHLMMMKRYSQVTIICVPSDYDIDGFIKYYEEDGRFTKNGKTFITYKVYKPSSEMNSYEFTVLLDGVISECKEMGIEVLTPEQIKELKENNT